MKDALKHIEAPERKSKLQEAFNSVIEGYKQTLASLVGGELDADDEEEEDGQHQLGVIAEEE